MIRSTPLICVGLILSGLMLSCAKKPDEADTSSADPVPRDLLAADLSNCTYSPEGWTYEGGVLAWQASKGDVWTKAQYGDFILELDWKIVAECNSGILIRCSDPEDWFYTALEVQIHETGDGSAHGQCGAIYSLASPPYFENAKLVVARGEQEWILPAVKGQRATLAEETVVTVQKVFTNLRMLERDGKSLPYNARSETASNPAVLVNIKPSRGEPLSTIVYPDSAKNEPVGDYALQYRLAHWLPDRDVRHPVGQWNHFKITAQGPILQVELNDTLIIDIDLDQYSEIQKNPQGTFNKYQIPVKEMARRGHIGLQDHGHAVWFKDIRITPLD